MPEEDFDEDHGGCAEQPAPGAKSQPGDGDGDEGEKMGVVAIYAEELMDGDGAKEDDDEDADTPGQRQPSQGEPTMIFGDEGGGWHGGYRFNSACAIRYYYIAQCRLGLKCGVF